MQGNKKLIVYPEILQPLPPPSPTLDGVSTLTLSREGFRKKMVTQMIQ